MFHLISMFNLKDNRLNYKNQVNVRKIKRKYRVMFDKNIFKFETISNKNIENWLEICNHSENAWHTTFDDFQINEKIKNNHKFNLIIYKDNDPIAIFSSRFYTKDFKVFKLNILNSHFEGLIIHKKCNDEFKLIYEYFNIAIVNEYFKKKLKIDLIIYNQSPINVEKLNNNHLSNIKCFKKEIKPNKLLLYRPNKHYLEKKTYNFRREVKKGLKNLENFKIITDKKLHCMMRFFLTIELIVNIIIFMLWRKITSTS